MKSGESFRERKDASVKHESFGHHKILVNSKHAGVINNWEKVPYAGASVIDLGIGAGKYGYDIPTRKIIRPTREDKDSFSEIYFAIEDALVKKGILQEPEAGDDMTSIHWFFWKGNTAYSLDEFRNLLEKAGLTVELEK